MTNSVRRLTSALTRFLNDDLLPTVAEPYLRGQLFAAINVLDNIGVAARWDHDPSATQLSEEATLAASMAALTGGSDGRLAKPERDRAVAELARALTTRSEADSETRELKRLVLAYLDLDLRAARSRTAKPAMAKLTGTSDNP